MTLKDLHSKPLSEIIEKMDMVDLKVHSDNNGNIINIEIKYAAQQETDKGLSSDTPEEGIRSHYRWL